MGKQIADSMFSKLLAFTLPITLFVAIVFILEKVRTSPWISVALASYSIGWSCCSRGENATKSNLETDFLGVFGLERGEDDKGRLTAQERVCCWLPGSSWAGSYCDHQTNTLMGSQGSPDWKGPQENILNI